jgi:hypothetical protein
MSYGLCEYVGKTGARCMAIATVIVSSEGGKDPQRLCSYHEAQVAEESFEETIEDLKAKRKAELRASFLSRLKAGEDAIFWSDNIESLEMSALRMEGIFRGCIDNGITLPEDALEGLAETMAGFVKILGYLADTFQKMSGDAD